MKFTNGKEMLRKLQDTDLYCPSEGIYVFLYNDRGSIAYYYISEDEARKLSEQAKESDEYWGAFLGPGGWVVDFPEDDEEGESPFDWCDKYCDIDWIEV